MLDDEADADFDDNKATFQERSTRGYFYAKYPRGTTTAVTKIVHFSSCRLVCSKPQQIYNFVSSYAHVCSRMLTYAHVRSRVLTHAHACSCMLMYAHVCSRMLTYAHVCTECHPRSQSQTHCKPKPFPSRANLNFSNLTSSIVW